VAAGFVIIKTVHLHNQRFMCGITAGYGGTREKFDYV
jgi:hypothetical protein